MNQMKKLNRKNGKLILGDGELTGHQHTIKDKDADMFSLDDETRSLKLPKPALLRHEKNDIPAEHRDIQLPSGEPCVTTKRQWTPKGWEPVED